jgi:hypothetical protein
MLRSTDVITWNIIWEDTRRATNFGILKSHESERILQIHDNNEWVTWLFHQVTNH